jgi:KRAB domain-containing zinc finger protein
LLSVSLGFIYFYCNCRITTVEECKLDTHRVLECDLCNIPFQNLRSYLQHCHDKHRRHNRKIFCVRCALFFSKKQLLIEHIEDFHSSITGEAEIILKVSKEALKDVEELQDIKEINYAKSKQYTCKICSKSFPELKHYVRHRKNTHKPVLKNYKKFTTCEECGIECPGFNAYRRHKRTHNISKPRQNKPPNTHPLTCCPFCEHKAPNPTKMSEHIMEAHEDQSLPEFVCETCGKIFNYITALKTHIKNMHSNIGQLCEDCGKYFKSKCSFKNHLRTHTLQPGRRKMECAVCDKFIFTSAFLQHMQRHIIERPHKCLKCNFEFKSISSLQQHQVARKKGKRIACEICGLIVCNLPLLNEHMKIHTDKTGIFVCPLCQECRLSIPSLAEHIKESHTEMEIEKYRTSVSQNPSENLNPEITTETTDYKEKLTCNFCQVVSEDVPSYVTHRQTHPEAFSKKCRFCNRRFKTATGVRSHELHHHKKEELCQCDLCPKTFTNSKALSIHKLSVHRARSFICKWCDKGFATKNYLERHEETHVNSFPCVCDLCGKSHKTRRLLMNHMRKKHVTVEKFVCDKCSYACNKEHLILTHKCMLKDGAHATYNCTVCNKHFSSSVDLEHHTNLHSTDCPYLCNCCDKNF